MANETGTEALIVSANATDSPALPSRLDRPETSQHPNPSNPIWDEIERSNREIAESQAQQEATACFRHSGWAHARNAVYEALHRTLQPINRITAFDSCGMGAFVAQSIDHPGQYRILGSCCHDRFCLPCQADRARTVAHNAVDVLRGQPVRFVTLTIQANNLPLVDALKKLDAAFLRLRSHSFWKRHVTGGLAFTEVTWCAETNHWHPHLHVLTHGSYMSKDVLKREWSFCTGDSHIVDIRLIRDSTKVLQYCLKYAGKGTDHSYVFIPERLDEAIIAFKGRRFLVAFGDMRGIDYTDAGDSDRWETIGTLWSFLQLARDGDPEAIAVLTALDETAAKQAIGLLRMRSPPPKTQATRPSESQSRFELNGRPWR